MTISEHQIAAPTFTQMLSSLSGILDKAAAHCAANKIDPSTLLHMRLYPDMFPLVRQVQVATDHAKGAVARLAGMDPPSFADDEATFDDLKRRIARTLDFIASVPPAKLSADRTVEVKLPARTLTFPGGTYLLHFALPNFYFHVTTAYDILRHAGVPLGKRDYIGSIPG
ncbi:MAG: DUF1993 domain-containing protein [Alphaproteobacteria bacterium]|nr:DUF1993 domain-containing protein [Alphaproteobacteria bacterium]